MKRLLTLTALAATTIGLAGCQSNGWMSRSSWLHRDEAEECTQPSLTEGYPGEMYTSEPEFVPGPELYAPTPG